MSAKAPHEPPAARKQADRVDAPPAQAKTKRLSLNYALGWLHLLPKSAFPIRSREDMAVKISALLLAGPSAQVQEAGHGLPIESQQTTRNESDAH